MYYALWNVLPGRPWVKVVQLIVFLVIAVWLLLNIIFPAVAPTISDARVG